MQEMTEEQKIRLLACLAIPPMRGDLCGNPDDKEIVMGCARGGDCSQVETTMKGFRTLGAYTKLLEKLGAKSFGDCGIAYWIGSAILDNASQSDYEGLVGLLEQQGAPDVLIQQYRNRVPEKFIPHHTFQVLLAAKIKATNEDTDLDLAGVNLCIPSTGTVVKVESEHVVVEVDFVVWKNSEKTQLGLKQKQRKIPIAQVLPDNLTPETTVAMHWNWICWKTTPNQHTTLKKWNNRCIENFANI